MLILPFTTCVKPGGGKDVETASGETAANEDRDHGTAGRKVHFLRKVDASVDFSFIYDL